MNISFARSVMGAVLLCFFAAASMAAAHEYTLGSLKIVHPWTRATPAGATTAVGYLKITNTGSTPMRLTGATTAAAQRVEIHVMSMTGGVMSMRPVQGVDIAAGATVKLELGGIHLMLIGLRKPLLQEQMIPLTLAFAGGKTVAIELYVEAMGAAQGAHDH